MAGINSDHSTRQMKIKRSVIPHLLSCSTYSYLEITHFTHVGQSLKNRLIYLPLNFILILPFIVVSFRVNHIIIFSLTTFIIHHSFTASCRPQQTFYLIVRLAGVRDLLTVSSCLTEKLTDPSLVILGKQASKV